MAIKTIRDQERDLTIHVVTGQASQEEMHGALEAMGEGGVTALLLWDMSLAEVAHVTPDNLRMLIRKAAETGATRQGGKTAIIAPEDLQFGLGRMSEVFAEIESAPYDLRVFRTREEAFQWLGIDDPQK